ncbi:hypothetical protein Acr_15g0003740 [Actinidia rufa]|uniref:Late embryogenesis abundant (LEA) hydroxyproline-rich glycoprotein family n=1 Tax=Actinidia rufa TaxID=165716 RepID=A0A7J0FSU9_9ERIC|nr:hypothetical protein Acr_15g0003740 [Actinidia rufa]
MAASGFPTSGSGPMLPLPKPPSRSQSFQRTPSRRVYFAETPSKHDTCRDTTHEDSLGTLPRHHCTDWEYDGGPKKCSGCGLCCACASLIAGCIVLILVLFGALSYSFVQGSMPDFRIRSFNITRLEVSPKDKPTTLTADVHFVINATNKYHRFELSYGTLNVDVSAGKINLGHTEVAPFKQSGVNVRELDLKVGVKDMAVDSGDALALKSDREEKNMVINVVFKGSISFNFEGHQLKDMPLSVLCHNVEQSDVYNGLRPLCHVRIFNFL